MNPPFRQVFRFERFSLDQIRGSLSDDHDDIELRPKTFAVLQFLVENAGRLLSKDEILQAVWPDVIVTEDSLVRCVHEARLALGDRDQRLIRTVPRRGYLFDAPVSIAIEGEGDPVRLEKPGAVPDAGNSETRPTTPGAPRDLRFLWLAIICVVLAAALIAQSSFATRQPASVPVRDQPSIAVLPFVNLSGDPNQEFFSDGISEDLITSLSAFSDLLVVARNSSFSYREKALRTNRIGNELGVRYLLHGSVRRDASRLRVTAQLVDTQSEKQLWAKRFDRKTKDVFALQDAVTQEIVATIASSIRIADATRTLRVPTGDLSAYELVLRAREISFRAATRQSTVEGRVLAQRAIAIDPSYAQAHVELGRTYYRAFALEWEGTEALDAAAEAAQRAISLDQSSASAHELLGRVYLRHGRHDAAIATLEKAIALNVNRADSYASLADALTFAGRARDAIPLLEKTIRLDPFYPPQIDMYLGRALYFDRRYEQAELALTACTARAPAFRPCYMYLAPVYTELGRMEDAQRTVARLLELSPQFTVGGSVRRHLPFAEAAMRRYAEGLLKAGVPEK